MTLIRCSAQKRQTLEEYYSDFIPDKNKDLADVGTAMLSVIKLIKDTFKDTKIYGLTSHATLLLLAKDNYETPSFVAISSTGNEFRVEYTMTPDKQPWPNARVNGETKNLLGLKKLIIIAMSESQGWSESNELKNLRQKLNSDDTWVPFKHVYFQDSYVLNIIESSKSIIFKMELVITEGHDLYEAPKPEEQYCYKEATLEFHNVLNSKWVVKNLGVISIDANNEADLGNIDLFSKNENEYSLEGDWGKIIITSDEPKIIYK